MRFKSHLSVNGQWSEWQSVTACSKSCEGGTRMMERTCTEPKPVMGGLPCSGLGVKEEQNCSPQPCPGEGNIFKISSDPDSCRLLWAALILNYWNNSSVLGIASHILLVSLYGRRQTKPNVSSDVNNRYY